MMCLWWALIDIHQNNNKCISIFLNEEAVIMWWLSETTTNEISGKLHIPLSGDLFQGVQWSIQFTYLSKSNLNVTFRGPHINFFLQVPMQKCIVNIHLVYFPLLNCGQVNQYSKFRTFRNRWKTLMEVNSFDLCKSLSHKAWLRFVYRIISIVFPTKFPWTTNRMLVRWKIHYNLGVVLL